MSLKVTMGMQSWEGHCWSRWGHALTNRAIDNQAYIAAGERTGAGEEAWMRGDWSGEGGMDEVASSIHLGVCFLE